MEQLSDNFDKWKNYPAPELSNEILDAVSRIGGLIPHGCGEFAGKSYFKLAWGMEAQKFANGKERMRFPARGRRIKRFYGMHPEMHRQVIAFIEREQKRQQDNYYNLRLSESYRIIEATPFIKGNYIAGVDYIEIDSDLSVQDIATKLALRGFQFFADVCVFEQIGKPFWYLLRFMPTPQQQKTVAKGYGTMLDTPQSWNSQRFGLGHCPETGQEEFLDLLGEYPSDGGYLADFFCFETVEPLTVSMVEEVLTRYVKGREALSARYVNDPEYRRNEQYLQDLEEFDNETMEWEETFEDMFWNAIPAFDRLGIFSKGKTVSV